MTVVNSTLAASVVMTSPSTHIMVSLGLENFLPITTAYMFYNYIALGILFFIASMAGARNEARFCVFIPMLAGIFSLIGWLNAPNPATTWAIMIVTGLLGVMIYMNEVNHEKFGIAGPGSKLINIVLYIVLFQAALGMVNGLGLFSDMNTQVSPSACYVGDPATAGQGYATGATCDAYGQIQLSESVTSVTQSGGLLSKIVAVVTALGSMALMILQFVVMLALTIIGAPFVINSTMNSLFPGISSNAIYLAFMAVVAVVFWAADVIFLFNIISKPTPSEGSV